MYRKRDWITLIAIQVQKDVRLFVRRQKASKELVLVTFAAEKIITQVKSHRNRCELYRVELGLDHERDISVVLKLESLCNHNSIGR